MQIVDDGAAAQIEQILAQATIACTPSLPVPNMCKSVFNCYPLAEFAAPLWSLLVLA